MKTRCIVALPLILAATTIAGAQSLEEKYQKKLQLPFAKKIAWIHSLEEAQRMARESGKPIFAYFTRSYSP